MLSERRNGELVGSSADFSRGLGAGRCDVGGCRRIGAGFAGGGGPAEAAPAVPPAGTAGSALGGWVLVPGGTEGSDLFGGCGMLAAMMGRGGRTDLRLPAGEPDAAEVVVAVAAPSATGGALAVPLW